MDGWMVSGRASSWRYGVHEMWPIMHMKWMENKRQPADRGVMDSHRAVRSWCLEGSVCRIASRSKRWIQSDLNSFPALNTLNQHRFSFKMSLKWCKRAVASNSCVQTSNWCQLGSFRSHHLVNVTRLHAETSEFNRGIRIGQRIMNATW